MNKLFVDTAAWVAAVDSDEKSHVKICEARDAWLKTGGILVTSDYVIDETLTLMRMRFGITVCLKWWKQIESSTRVLTEWMTPERTEKARALFFKHEDKKFSFTDCTSFVVMQELKIKTALTLDKHFVQKGFLILPN